MSEFRGILAPVVEFQTLRREAGNALQANGLWELALEMDHTTPDNMQALLLRLNSYISIPELSSIKAMRAWADQHKEEYEPRNKNTTAICT